MSPQPFAAQPKNAVVTALRRLWVGIGQQVRDARIAHRWTVPQLADHAGVSRSVVYDVESGQPISIEAVARLATALGLRVEWQLVDPRRASKPTLGADPVHSAMGELEARHLRGLGFAVGIDEPFQHYQFAGRADLVSWDAEQGALLHIENRTRFPDFQDMAGSYNAKRAYFGASLAERLGFRRWRSETHVIAALWSSEVLHGLRLRSESFRSLCPDPPDAFSAWWSGAPPASGTTSMLIVLDPAATARQRLFIGRDEAVNGTRPRHRGYADATQRLGLGGPAGR
jgi:DNA-binding XRE family transcriptional regulator